MSSSFAEKPTNPTPHPQTKWWRWRNAFILILAGIGSVSCAQSSISPQAESQTQQNQPTQQPTTEASPNSQKADVRNTPPLPSSDNRNFIVNAVNSVGKAVVRIDATRTVTPDLPEFFQDPFFRRFFGENLPTPKRKEEGTGSGFLINRDGYLLTNAHVVRNATDVSVTLKDGRTLSGKVVGADSVTDVAVVKVDGENLPSVQLGNSDDIQPGQWAIAIGNPLGLDNTVTVGIISATGRSSSEVGVPDKRVGFIQTDAAINPGNSGGPLINGAGEVIGMNTAIIRGAQGLGFAIPINTVKQIADELIATGEVQHPFIGIRMITIDEEIRQRINSDPNSPIEVNVSEGVLILEVVPNSPAAQAGLQPGDIIQQMEGQAIEGAEKVQQIVQNTEIGADLSVEVLRDGETVNLTLQPAPLPSQE
ncbi:HhoA/HhoB/HtrA family serine endopeptidase [Geitlerinema sp. PCC 9228]|jgi:S1-C subfamily serine protease|uniref:HhoA/HhoB/HtrA family serine endopeptidase n=1 Tax=Geitlerinema sp. PCC 9228 TaxID=111611 RepID=UPI0008F98A98|nr:HhoA/HhoB/HtrA family serine endopeptidase [Geitlerinema sp. PCC 9228]